MVYKNQLLPGEALKYIVEALGGPTVVSKVCGITRNCIYRWFYRGGLPRTEYTGQTHYAEKMARISKGRLKKEHILHFCNPGKRNSEAATIFEDLKEVLRK